MMNPLNPNVNLIESAQLAAIDAANRESASQRNRGRRIASTLVLVAAAVGVILLIVLCQKSPTQEIYSEEWENGQVVITAEGGVQREREYLDESGHTLKIESFDADGNMTGYSEFAYTYGASGEISERTEYQYDAEGSLISETHNG